MQTLDFQLDNKQRVRTVLRPQPNTAGTQVAYVELDASFAGSDVLSRISSATENLSVIQAGVRAVQYAQSEAERLKTQISRAELDGEEFLEMADVVEITGNAFPVNELCWLRADAS